MKHDRWWWTKYNYRIGKLMDFLELSWCKRCDGTGHVSFVNSNCLSVLGGCPRCHGSGIIVDKLERRSMYEQLREEFEKEKEDA